MKSIVEKLNLTKYQQLVILNRPQGEYLSEFASAAQQLPSEPVELIFAFVKTMAEFQEIVSMVIEGQHLVENGLWLIRKKAIKCIQPLSTEMKFFQHYK